MARRLHENGALYCVGDTVQKRRGYRFPGVVVAVYETLNGDTRYVVECTAESAEGCQHIFNEGQLDYRDVETPDELWMGVWDEADE